MVVSKNGKNPYHTQSAGSGQGYHHGKDGISHPPETAHQRIHPAADKISRADNGHPEHSIRNHFRIRRINFQKIRSPITAKKPRAIPTAVTVPRQINRIRFTRVYMRAPIFWLVKLKFV